jgi:hypothetical protein
MTLRSKFPLWQLPWVGVQEDGVSRLPFRGLSSNHSRNMHQTSDRNISPSIYLWPHDWPQGGSLKIRDFNMRQMPRSFQGQNPRVMLPGRPLSSLSEGDYLSPTTFLLLLYVPLSPVIPLIVTACCVVLCVLCQRQTQVPLCLPGTKYLLSDSCMGISSIVSSISA